jgi:hypothetical protein
MLSPMLTHWVIVLVMIATLKGRDVGVFQVSLLSAASFPSCAIASHRNYSMILTIAMRIPNINSVIQV